MTESTELRTGEHSDRVSVALCTRNGARFVERQLASIFEQTYPVHEVVVSDDASEDDTVMRVHRSFARRPHGSPTALSVVVNQSALGVRRNFEQAIQRTTGTVVALCDQDDIWHRDRVARAIQHFAETEALLVHSDALLVDADGESLGMTLFEALEFGVKDIVLENSGAAFGILLRRNVVTGAATLLRRDFAVGCLPVPEDWLHDEWFGILAAAQDRIFCDGSATIDYRQHGSNQIGVAAPSMRTNVRRVFGTTSERNRLLARRSRQLVDRLAADGEVEPAYLRASVGKQHFESARAGLDRRRARRVLPVVRMLLEGSYSRFASQGRLDVIRDLVRSH